MRSIVDEAGRLVVAKALREELGLAPGQELELRAVDGRLEVELPAAAMRLQECSGDVVAATDRQMPQLTSELVPETLEQIRR